MHIGDVLFAGEGDGVGVAGRMAQRVKVTNDQMRDKAHSLHSRQPAVGGDEQILRAGRQAQSGIHRTGTYDIAHSMGRDGHGAHSFKASQIRGQRLLK